MTPLEFVCRVILGTAIIAGLLMLYAILDTIAGSTTPAGGDNIGRILPTLKVTRSPQLDEPVRQLDPSMTGEEAALLDHALGSWAARPGTGGPDRNSFCDTADGARVRTLVLRGWMVPGCEINGGRDRYFHVTPAGFRALGLPVPANT